MIRLQKMQGSLAPVATLATRIVWHAGIRKKEHIETKFDNPLLCMLNEMQIKYYVEAFHEDGGDKSEWTCVLSQTKEYTILTICRVYDIIFVAN